MPAERPEPRDPLAPTDPLAGDVRIDQLNDREWRYMWHHGKVQWSIARQVHDIRVGKGWSQDELAQRADTNQATISRIENPRGRCPSLNTLIRIAAAFDCAFICRFVRWREWLDFMKLLEEGHTGVLSFEEEVLHAAD